MGERSQAPRRKRVLERLLHRDTRRARLGLKAWEDWVCPECGIARTWGPLFRVKPTEAVVCFACANRYPEADRERV